MKVIITTEFDGQKYTEVWNFETLAEAVDFMKEQEDRPDLINIILHNGPIVPNCC